MNRDIMLQIAALRPTYMTPAHPVDKTVREKELAIALSYPMDDRSRRGRSIRRRPAPLGRVVGFGMSAAAAATAVAVAVTLHSPVRRPSEATKTPARQVLLTAADAAAKMQAASGAYWFTDDLYGASTLIHGRYGSYIVQGRTENRQWLPDRSSRLVRKAADGSVTYYQADRDYGEHPAGRAATAAWRRDGSPARWPSILPGETTKGIPWAVYKNQAAPAITFNARSLARLRHLPTSPAGLREYFLSHPNGDVSASQNVRQDWQTDQQWLVTAACYLLSSEPVPGAVRAAAFRVLSEIPGVRAVGPVTDPLGRRGFAILMPEASTKGHIVRINHRGHFASNPQRGVTAVKLIVDPHTGLLLATEDIVVEPGPDAGNLPVGSVASWTAVRAAHWTSKAPPQAIREPA